MAAQVMDVEVMTPKQTLFKGKALAVSSKDLTGKFDILPMHANFIAIVENQPVRVIKEDRQVLEFNFIQAIIYNSMNKVTVFAEPKI